MNDRNEVLDDDLPPCVGEKMRDIIAFDLLNFGVCFEVNGKRVHPADVKIHRRGSTTLEFHVQKGDVNGLG